MNRKWVPFKAVDSLIDALARSFEATLHERARLPAPPRRFALGSCFPGAPERGGRARGAGPSAELPDPQELRMRVFAGLRDLLGRLGRQTNLVLMIDDLQWGDVDSAVLLADLIYTPDPPILLFLGSYRLEDADQNRFLQILRQARNKGPGSSHHRDLAVEALTQAESRELALALLGRDDTVSRAQAHIIARESAGNPLFIDELVKHLQAGAPSADRDAAVRIELEIMLWIRIQALPIDAQRLLEVVAVAGRPIHESLAFRTAELGAGGRVALASCAGAAHPGHRSSPARSDRDLSRPGSRDRPDAIFRPPRRRWCHERLARVLEVSGQADPEVMADHFLGAGDRLRPASSMTRPPTRPKARWRLITLPGSTVRLSISIVTARCPAPAGQEAGRRAVQRRPGGRGRRGLSASRRRSDRGGNPGAEAAGLDPASDQRPRR